MEQLIIIVLLAFLVSIAIGIIVLQDLLSAVILLGLYSLVAAVVFVVMDAVDVAFTEAAVGSGISTILLLGALSFTRHGQTPRRRHDNPMVLLFVVLTGSLLIYGTLDMPWYGNPQSPAQSHPEIARHYLQKSAQETGLPNVVTSVLASYRGYDTLGETVVVFTAGIAVISLLGLRRRRPEKEAPEDAPGDLPLVPDEETAPPGDGPAA
jgi:multicomponent Na+:H+ antiporter subunit B